MSFGVPCRAEPGHVRARGRVVDVGIRQGRLVVAVPRLRLIGRRQRVPWTWRRVDLGPLVGNDPGLQAVGRVGGPRLRCRGGAYPLLVDPDQAAKERRERIAARDIAVDVHPDAGRGAVRADGKRDVSCGVHVRRLSPDLIHLRERQRRPARGTGRRQVDRVVVRERDGASHGGCVGRVLRLAPAQPEESEVGGEGTQGD